MSMKSSDSFGKGLVSVGLSIFIYMLVFCNTFMGAGETHVHTKFTANQYCICLSIPQIYTKADAVQTCGTFWDTPYMRKAERNNREWKTFITKY